MTQATRERLIGRIKENHGDSHPMIDLLRNGSDRAVTNKIASIQAAAYEGGKK